MRGHRQGAIIHGVHDMGGAVPLYDYSGIGVDMGAEMALYDYSGIGVDMGGVGDYFDQVGAAFDGLPGWAQTSIKIAGALAIVGLATGAVKAKSLNPLSMLGGAKKRTNSRSRRRTRRNRSTTRRRTRRNRSVSRRRSRR